MEKIENPYRKALEFLDGGKRWYQGELRLWDGDRIVKACLIGAIKYNGIYSDECATILTNIIIAEYGDKLDPWLIRNYPFLVTAWFNDHYATTFADVEKVLEKAAVSWDETH